MTQNTYLFISLIDCFVLVHVFDSLSAKVGKRKKQQRAGINVQFRSEPKRYWHNLIQIKRYWSTGRVGTMRTPPSLRDPHGTVHRQRGQADLAATPDRDRPDEFPPLGQASMRAPDRVQRDREK